MILTTEHIRLVIELKRDANPNVVLNNLFKYTQMQDTFGIILLALVDKQPKILTLREMIDYYIAHQEDVISRRPQFELDKALDRAHILEGYKIVIDNADEVIKIIRHQRVFPDAKQTLCERFSLTDAQSDAIVKMQLGRLSGMERDKIEEEYQALVIKIEDLRSILADESKVLEIIKNDLTDIKNKYGDERRTEISMVTTEIDIDDLIDEEDIVVTVTHKGYTKRLPVDTYKSQRRGGRGISGLTTREEDFVEHLFTTTTHHTLLFFTTRGVVYKLKGYQIPEASRQAKGTAIVNLLPLENDEKISAMIPLRTSRTANTLHSSPKTVLSKRQTLWITQKSVTADFVRLTLTKTMNLSELNLQTILKILLLLHMTVMQSALTKLRYVQQAVQQEVLWVSAFTTATMLSVRLLHCPTASFLLSQKTVTARKHRLTSIVAQSRGGKGIFTYRITEKTGKLAGMKTVTDNDDIILITSDGVIIRMHTDEISSYSRQTQGVRVMRLDDGVSVMSIARAEREEETDEETENSEEVIADDTTETQIADESETEGDVE